MNEVKPPVWFKVFFFGVMVSALTIFFVSVALLLYMGTAFVSDPSGTMTYMGGLVKQFLEAAK